MNKEFFEILRLFPEGVLIAQVELSKRDLEQSLSFQKDMHQFLHNLTQSHEITVNFTNKSMDDFLFGKGNSYENNEANFEKKIFKVYKFGESKKINENGEEEILNQDEDLQIEEKVKYSLKDLILLNYGKNRLMYFEITDEENKSSIGYSGDFDENSGLNKYGQDKDAKDVNVLEFKFQKIVF
jgi:hypothetical protein